MSNSYDFRTIQGTGYWTDNCTEECDADESDNMCIHEIEDNEGDSDNLDF